MNPIIFKNITHSFDKVSVISNFSIEIEENFITSIIGKSGAGKSTLLQMINGLILPDSGDVLIFGEKINYDNIQELRLNIGYSVQGTCLFPHMNVYDNISLPAKIKKNDDVQIKMRIELLMELVGLPGDFKKKFPYQLSGGEQQRVGLCRAMLLNPKIFLLDEAFGALDSITRHEIHKELLKLQKFEPRTIVMVTHDLQEALYLSDKILILDKGITQQYGNKNEILNNPKNNFVKDFVNSVLN